MDKGFSVASVVLSYFMVAGGLLAGFVVVTVLKLQSEYLGYALFAAGSFLGGFFAARASRGSTILEPAIGALLVIATVAAMIATTAFGKLFWNVAPDAVTKAIVAVAGSTLIGAVAGAFISEKVFGEATRSSAPWVIYAALSSAGACTLATFIAVILVMRGSNSDDEAATLMLVGMGVGCLLSGIAIGASARTRPLIATVLGSAVGVAAFFSLIANAGSPDTEKNLIAVITLGVGGGIVGLIGSALGWSAVGRKYADA